MCGGGGRGVVWWWWWGGEGGAGCLPTAARARPPPHHRAHAPCLTPPPPTTRRLKHYRFLRPAANARAVKQALRFVQLLPRQYADARTYNMLLTVRLGGGGGGGGGPPGGGGGRLEERACPARAPRARARTHAPTHARTPSRTLPPVRARAQVCAAAGDLRNALHVADMLQMVGLKMDAILYTNLMKGGWVGGCECVGGWVGGWEWAVHLTAASRMHGRSLAPPPPPRPPAVCAAAGDAERAFQLYGEMREARVPPCKQAYATLIKACAEAISRAPPSDRSAPPPLCLGFGVCPPTPLLAPPALPALLSRPGGLGVPPCSGGGEGRGGWTPRAPQPRPAPCPLRPPPNPPPPPPHAPTHPHNRRKQLVLLERAFGLVDDMQALHVQVSACVSACACLPVRLGWWTTCRPCTCRRACARMYLCAAARACCAPPHGGTLPTLTHPPAHPTPPSQPDTAVWNALVTAAGRAGQLQRAFNVLEDMLQVGWCLCMRACVHVCVFVKACLCSARASRPAPPHSPPSHSPNTPTPCSTPRAPTTAPTPPSSTPARGRGTSPSRCACTARPCAKSAGAH